MKTYEIHPLCKIIPQPTDAEYERIKEDIRVNGLNHDVILFEGKILDGRTRDRACREVGVACRYETFNGTFDEAVNRVISENLNLRHLSESQRAMAAAELATMKRGGGGNRFQKSRTRQLTGSKKSADEAAKLFNVSKSSVERAKALKRKAVKQGKPEVVEQVRSGKKSVSGALRDMKKAEKAEKPAGPLTGERNVRVSMWISEKDRATFEREAKQLGKSMQRMLEEYTADIIAPSIGPNLKEVRERDLALTGTKLGGLSIEEVDPDFKGTPLERAREFGLVNLRTKREIDQEKFDRLLEELLANIERIPLDAITAQYLQGWIDGGKPPKFREEQLAKRWDKLEALYERLAALVAQLESARSGRPVAVGQ